MNLDPDERARRVAIANEMLQQLEDKPVGLSQPSSDLLTAEDKAALFVMNIAEKTGCDNAARQRIGDKALEAVSIARGDRRAYIVVDTTKSPGVIDFMVARESELPAGTSELIDLSGLVATFRRE